MAAFMGRTQVGIEKTGTSANIPDNPKGKLMYYLNCICSLIDFNAEGGLSGISRLRDYANYHRLTSEETNTLLELCLALAPPALDDKIIFQSDAMCGDSSNEFYKISALSNNFLVSDSLAIGGRQLRVSKIMTYKMSWLKNNWIDPMDHFRSLGIGPFRSRVQQRREEESNCTIL